jgi:oxygen-independent coproporphyrinogen-3 oxidase
MEKELGIRLESYLKIAKTKSILKSVYFGGGTPSLIPVSYYEHLFTLIKHYLPETELCKVETTIEVNPESVSQSYLTELSSIGINRLSIGIQSLDNDTLVRMGRIHDIKTAFEAAEMVRKTFRNMSCDFIVGYETNPFQSLDSIDRFICLFQPDQLCFYPIEIHTGTCLAKETRPNEKRLASSERIGDFFVALHAFLKTHGYIQYEISSFARRGFFSIHNLAYWNNESYLGIGVSAGGHFYNYRYVNSSDIPEYIRMISIRSHIPMAHEHTNSEEEECTETLFMALRKSEGISVKKLFEVLPLHSEAKFLDFVRCNNEFVLTGKRLFLTEYCFFHNYTALEKIVNFFSE